MMKIVITLGIIFGLFFIYVSIREVDDRKRR